MSVSSNLFIHPLDEKVQPDPEKFIKDILADRAVHPAFIDYQRELRLCIRRYSKIVDKDEIVSIYCFQFHELHKKGTLKVGRISAKIRKKFARDKRKVNLPPFIVPVKDHAIRYKKVDDMYYSFEDGIDHTSPIKELVELLALGEDELTIKILKILEECPTTKQADIAQILGVNKLIVSRRLARLAKKWSL